MKKKSNFLILGLSIALIIGLSSSFTVHSLEFTNKTLKYPIKVVVDYTEDIDRIIKLPTEYTYNNNPLILDLNDDGKLETVIISDRINETAPSLILLFSGEELVEGWPIQVNFTVEEILGKRKVEGKEAIIFRVADYNLEKRITSFIAITEEGEIIDSFQIDLLGSFIHGTIFYDLNENGIEEFVVVRNDGWIYYIDYDGNNISAWPKQFQINATVFLPPIVEDINNDSFLDIILCTEIGKVYAWNLNGTLLSGYPLTLPIKTYGNITDNFRVMPIVTDLENDGTYELLISSTLGFMYGIVLNPVVNESWTVPLDYSIWKETQAIAMDLNNDNLPAIIQPFYKGIILLEYDGELNKTFRNAGFFRCHGTPAIADIDNDNVPEIIAADYNYLRVIDSSGVEKERLWKGIVTDSNSPLVYDIDNDKEIEVVYLNSRGEIYIFETNDYGLMPWTSQYGSSTHTTNRDYDNDGLWDYEEKILKTREDQIDTDGDTVSDGLEVNQYALNPVSKDSNGDTDLDLLENIEEVDIHRSNPMNPDSDFDSLTDGEEVLIYFTSPLSDDTDNDKMTDAFEVTYDSLDPNNAADALGDADDDNLINKDEQSYGTNPEDPDTDKDGLLDGDEVHRYITNPRISDKDADYDGDGLTNVEEADIYRTDPSQPDSDFDGFEDGVEIDKGSDPLDPNSIPTIKTSFLMNNLIIVPVLIGIRKWKKRKKERKGVK